MKTKSKLPIKSKFIQIRVTEQEQQMIKQTSKSLNKSVTQIILEHFKSMNNK